MKYRLGHCPPRHALVRVHQNTSNHQSIWWDFDGFTSSKLEIESYRGQKLLRLKSHTRLHPRSHYTDGMTFPFFNQWTVCFCCSQAFFSFQRKEIKKETRGCLQHCCKPGPTVCNHPFLWSGLPETLGLTCWDCLVSQWHWSSSRDTSGEVRKLSAEWETPDKNSKVPLIPSFQQAIMLTNMPALFWWAQQKLAERWLNDNVQKYPASGWVSQKSCAWKDRAQGEITPQQSFRLCLNILHFSSREAFPWRASSVGLHHFPWWKAILASGVWCSKPCRGCGPSWQVARGASICRLSPPSSVPQLPMPLCLALTHHTRHACSLFCVTPLPKPLTQTALVCHNMSLKHSVSSSSNSS